MVTVTPRNVNIHPPELGKEKYRKMADTTRMDAIHSLVEQLKNSYPQKGFLIHPSIAYVHNNDKGICVIAKNAIKLNDILLVIPESATMATKNIQTTFDSKTINFDKLIKDVEKKLSHILQDPHEVPNHLLSLIVMYAISNYQQEGYNNDINTSSLSSAVFMNVIIMISINQQQQ